MALIKHRILEIWDTHPSITTGGRPILGGADINATDYAFVGRIYPKSGGNPDSGCSMPARDLDAAAAPSADAWGPDEDVESPNTD